MGSGFLGRVVVFACLGLLLLSALAQPEVALSVPISWEPLAQTGLSASDISSEKVNQFVQAYLQVLQLLEQREADLQGAPTPLEALQIEREIEQEALSTIETTGLTRQEYLQLLSLANVDREFGERIAAQLQESP
jgi:hypothetical protein